MEDNKHDHQLEENLPFQKVVTSIVGKKKEGTYRMKIFLNSDVETDIDIFKILPTSQVNSSPRICFLQELWLQKRTLV